MLLLFPIGIVQLVVVLLAISIPLDMITYPLWFEPLKGGERISEFGVQLGNSISSSETPETIIQVGPYAMDTTPEILLTVFVGLLLVVAGLFLIRLSARMHAAFAMTLLGPDPLRFPRLTRRFAPDLGFGGARGPGDVCVLQGRRGGRSGGGSVGVYLLPRQGAGLFRGLRDVGTGPLLRPASRPGRGSRSSRPVP